MIFSSGLKWRESYIVLNSASTFRTASGCFGAGDLSLCLSVCLSVCLSLSLSLSLVLSVLTATFPGEPGLASFIEAKDDESGGDNWSHKSCKAAVKSSPPITNIQLFTGRMAFLSPGPTNCVKALRNVYSDHISLRAFVGQPMWKVVTTSALLPPWRLLSRQCSDQLLVTVPFLSLHRGRGTAYHLPSELFHPSPPFGNNWRHICLGLVWLTFYTLPTVIMTL